MRKHEMALRIVESFDLRCPCLSCGRKNESKHFGACHECVDAKMYADLLHEEELTMTGCFEERPETYNSSVHGTLHCNCSYEISGQ